MGGDIALRSPRNQGAKRGGEASQCGYTRETKLSDRGSHKHANERKTSCGAPKDAQGSDESNAHPRKKLAETTHRNASFAL